MTEDEHSRQQPFSGIRHLGYVQIKLDWTRTWQLSIRRSQATVGVELSPHMVTHEPAMLAQGCSTLLSPPFPPMYRFLVHFTTFIHLYRTSHRAAQAHASQLEKEILPYWLSPVILNASYCDGIITIGQE
ncbi:hypothetical protein IAQ61_002365, partial [Plenodomus lingam]|uniref:Predicted protein n=1 Tax=Leptosphaeria maculans (strain JN3 / isolate v23.1.3 / race Av1-4-5-6-7-8) TaxID=985895 RepID=E4ZHR2_LEPMJ